MGGGGSDFVWRLEDGTQKCRIHQCLWYFSGVDVNKEPLNSVFLLTSCTCVAGCIGKVYLRRILGKLFVNCSSGIVPICMPWHVLHVQW